MPPQSVLTVLRQIGAVVIPTDPVAFWTCILASGTVALAIMAGRGLHSLKLTRADMLTRARREASQSAVSRAEEWAREVIPANAEIITLMRKNAIAIFVKEASEVQFDPDNAADLKRAQEWVRQLPQDLYRKSVALLNRMEGWAMYFVGTAPLADQKIAFGPCAPTFCSMIVQSYAVLLANRAQKPSGKFPNAIALFKVWLADLEKEERGLKRGNLLKELEDLLAKDKAPQITLPPPLGTDLDGN
jgi:hypothetical protein